MEREFTDSLGRTIRFDWPPIRVVSLVASQTETLALLGLGERLVGRTRYCVEPRGAIESVPVVGGEKSPEIGTILALKPDLVIANKEENKKSDVERLEQAGVAVHVAYPRTLPEGAAMIRDLGALTGTEEAASRLAGPIEELLAPGPPPARLRGFCFVWKDPWMVAGGDNFVHDMMRWAGIRNLGAEFEGRYPTVGLEKAMALEPEVLLLPDEPYAFSNRDLGDFASWPKVPAMAQGRIFVFDGKIVSWYGPRIADSLRALRALVANPA